MFESVPNLSTVRNYLEMATGLTEATAAKAMEVALRCGEDFVAPLEQSGVFPSFLTRMLRIGGETGNFTPSIKRATQILEDQLDRYVDRSLALLGPLIILILSVLVGFIIVSLMSAIISINDLAI